MSTATQYTDPQMTLKLLAALIRAAGSETAADDVFRLLHQTQGGLDPHRLYCEGVKSFLDDRNNARVQQRLEWVLDPYNNEAKGEQNALRVLAIAAYRAIPPVPEAGNTYERSGREGTP